MTLPIEAAIPDLLFTHVSDFAESESPPIAVSFPGRAFEPADGEVYLDVAYIPNRSSNFAVSHLGSSEYIGLLQVAVMWPSADAGGIDALTLAGRIAGHFKRGTRLVGDVTVDVAAPPSIAQPMDEPTHIRVPITVRYQCFARTTELGLDFSQELNSQYAPLV